MALMPVAKARERILRDVRALRRENVRLHDCHGRVLAADIKAKRDQPPFLASAMDGYAVRFADVGTTPVTLKVIGMAPAGHGFKGNVGSGEAVRIFTGAPVPRGADTVVIQENTSSEADRVRVETAARHVGQNVRRQGLDYKRGERLLGKGSLLGARRSLGGRSGPCRRWQ